MSVVAPAGASTATDPPAYRWRWVALFAILTAEVMDLLDALVTTIAGPTIRAELGAPESTIQWLAAGYTLAMAVGLVTGGRLGDLFGRRRMFLVGTGGFVVASLLCAVAQGEGTLVTAAGAAGPVRRRMLPQGLGLIKEMFPPTQVGCRVRPVRPGDGPVRGRRPDPRRLAGRRRPVRPGWRMIFLINLPLGLLGLLLGGAVHAGVP